MTQVSNVQAQESSLLQGNAAMRRNDHATAIHKYLDALQKLPGMEKTIASNLTTARRRYRASRNAASKPRVGVCGWELSHNAAGRVYTLAMLYETFAEVEIIGCHFPGWGREVWSPIRDTAISKHSFVVEDEATFIDQALQLVAAHPYDVVHLSKPRAPNIIFGLLYKLIWDAKVLIDIDDEELAFVGADAPIHIDDYLKQHGQLPELKDLAGKDWTRLAVGLLKEFDGVTVCNTQLQQRYGGQIVPHARDEKKFKPSPELKRKSREKYGISHDKKVVVFFGTPREHKGLIETAEIIASLKNPDVVFCIVGDFPDESLKSKLLKVEGCNFNFLSNQSIDDSQYILAIGDCCVLLQDPDSTITQYQTPAKISDALAMGLPILIGRAPALEEFRDAAVVFCKSTEQLSQELSKLLSDPASFDEISSKAHAFFLEKLTTHNIGRVLHTIIDALKFSVNHKTISTETARVLHNLVGKTLALIDQPQDNNISLRRTKEKNDQASLTQLQSSINFVDESVAVKINKPLLPEEDLNNSTFRQKLDYSDVNSIRGWCVNDKKPGEIFSVDIYLDGHFYQKTRNNGRRLDLKKKGISEGYGGLEFDNPAIFFSGGEHVISIRLPNGTFSESIIVKSSELIRGFGRIYDQFPVVGVTIVVPIYNAPHDVEVCIERLLAYTPKFAKILLIDDCSPDERIGQILKKYQDVNSIRIMRNAENMGFTRTVNKGIDEAGEDDVILLNSDARVTPCWLEGMLTAAYSAPNIATVTAMSDRAGAFSAPKMGNDNKLPEEVDEITFARAFRRRSLGLYPRVPTGNGFCMFVRRKCIKSIGSLDAEAFPRGYGEENDFCMRAVRAGWINVIDDRTYVFHDRSKSFGDTKTELMTAGRAVVDARYPEYKNAIRIFSTSEKIALARNRALLARQDCIESRGRAWVPRILFVIATQTGGTPQTNRDLMQALSGAFDGWILRSDSRMLELTHMSEDGKTRLVRSRKLLDPVDPVTHNSDEYDAVVFNWLQEFDFDLVHIRHLGWHGLSLPLIARQLGQKVVYSFHDFYALSSTFKLIDDMGIFLGENYFEESSIYRECLWPKEALPTPNGNWLKFWRQKFQNALVHCDAFVTTASSARRLILNAMPNLSADRFVVIPHGRDFSEFHRIRQKPQRGRPIRILVPGHINAVKGLEIIRALIEYDTENNLEFYILGRLIGKMPEKGIVALGSYERNEFADKARAVSPHIGIIFSIWDETYCHTLTELWSVGLPVAVLDFPNVASRVSECGAGWVLDHTNISALYNEIIRLTFDNSEYDRTEQALTEWQNGYGLANTTAQMASGYLNIYSDILRENRRLSQPLSPYSRKRIGVICPANPNLRHAPGSTHIRVWERTRNMVERNVTYIRMTPATLLASAKQKMLDGAIIQRTAVPQDMVENVILTLSHENIPYCLELDDDLLDVPLDKDPDGTYARYAPFLQSLIEHSAIITVSTPALQEKMKLMQANVVLLPNQLSDQLWRDEPEPRVKDNIIHALYMGTATHDDDLALILPALDAVAQASPNFKLSLVGITNKKDLTDGRPWLQVLDIPAKDYVNFTQWLRSLSAKFDFAVAPLRETNFNSRKSDLKLLDYGALGLPVIASDVSVYRTAKAPGVRLVSNTSTEWAYALREQIAFGNENRSLGSKLRNWVLQERMLGKTLSEYDELVTHMTPKKNTKSEAGILIKPPQAKIAVCVHIFYPHRWKLISDHLSNIGQNFDLFVTCPLELVSTVSSIKDEYPNSVIIPVENVGMDVLPFLTTCLRHELHRYDAVLKLHTKNDKAEIGDTLGRLALDGVLGTPDLVNRVINELSSEGGAGMVGSECLYRSAVKTMYANRPKVEKILRGLKEGWPDQEWGFFAGTMFWVRGSLLRILTDRYVEVTSDSHLEVANAITGGDGCWAHAMERVFGLLPVFGGKKVAVSYPLTERTGHARIRKVPSAKANSKRAFHGFSVTDLNRYKNLSLWVNICRSSGIFDETHYRNQAGENLPEEMDAITHFVLFGDIFGFNPNAGFLVSDYQRNAMEPDDLRISMPSLVHFLTKNSQNNMKNALGAL